MKKNLFILHTQYNIILGTGIMINRFKECQNDLIVYAEFSLNDNYKNILERVFNNVLYIRECFEPLQEGLWKIEKKLYKEYQLYKKNAIYKTAYDNSFISQDRALEKLIVGHCKELNSNCKFWGIDDGCDSYFSINPIMNNPDYMHGWHTKRSWIVRKLLYGSTYCTDERSGLYIYGQSSYFDGLYVIHPEAIRPQLKNKLAIEIKQKEILDGVNSLYGSIHYDIKESPQYALFFFDLLDRYNKPEKIKLIVERIIKLSSDKGIKVLLKYHPRESNKFDFKEKNERIIEIPSILPAEKLLCDLLGRKVTVYGNASTSVIVSVKFGFNTVSIAGLEGSNNIYMIKQFEKMGIRVPNEISEIN